MDAADAHQRDAVAGTGGARVATLGFGILLAWALLEVVLRLVPHLISPQLLLLFAPELRSKIAAGSFPVKKDFREIPRDDGGPPLLLEKPLSRIVSVDEPKDRRPRFTDELGFCNPPGRYDGADRLDVITIGDSFTWCHALAPEKAWPALLSASLGIRAYSLGEGGKGPYEYVQYLREFGLAKHPRVVVMNIYGGNDLRDADAYFRFRDPEKESGDAPIDEPTPIAPELAGSILGRHSYALNLVLALLSELAQQSRRGWARAGIDFHYEIEAADGALPFNVENRDRDEVLFARRVADGTTSPALWGDALARFGALARENGFTAIVSYTPSAHVVYAGHETFSDPSLLPLLDRLDNEQRRFLEQRADALGYVFYDLTPALREAADGADRSQVLYDPANMHLTAHGHEIVARSIGRLLVERGLVRAAASGPAVTAAAPASAF